MACVKESEAEAARGLYVGPVEANMLMGEAPNYSCTSKAPTQARTLALVKPVLVY